MFVQKNLCSYIVNLYARAPVDSVRLLNSKGPLRCMSRKIFDSLREVENERERSCSSEPEWLGLYSFRPSLNN